MKGNEVGTWPTSQEPANSLEFQRNCRKWSKIGNSNCCLPWNIPAQQQFLTEIHTNCTGQHQKQNFSIFVPVFCLSCNFSIWNVCQRLWRIIQMCNFHFCRSDWSKFDFTLTWVQINWLLIWGNEHLGKNFCGFIWPRVKIKNFQYKI